MKNKIILSCILIMLSLSIISAHNPRITFNKISSQEEPFIIENPEVSQAFYAELKNYPDYYQINSDKQFNLYIHLLSPDIKNTDTDFSMELYKDNNLIKSLNASSANWERFWEEFARDSYLNGPEYESSAEKGSYLIKITSPDNQGKYVFVVGKKEVWNIKETLGTIISIPQIKTQFFQKPIYTSYTNIVGLTLLILLIILSGIIIAIIWIYKRYTKKEKRR